MINRFLYCALSLAAFVLFVSGCDTGLEPLNEPSGFRGVIRFKNWPSADSLRELRLVAFEAFPRDSSGIIPTLLAGGAAVFPPLDKRFPFFVDSVEYEFTTKQGVNLQLKNYEYVIVAQQYGPNILTDWKPAGVYSLRPGTFEPAAVRVLLHRIAPNIDINVDFQDTPEWPWR